MINFTYLVGSLFTVVIWASLYYYRKDVRKEMLVMSSALGFLGIFMEGLVWTRDYWRPTTITGTLVGIEDILFGFSFAGISAVIYQIIFKRKLLFNKRNNYPRTKALLLFK